MESAKGSSRREKGWVSGQGLKREGQSEVRIHSRRHTIAGRSVQDSTNILTSYMGRVPSVAEFRSSTPAFMYGCRSKRGVERKWTRESRVREKARGCWGLRLGDTIGVGARQRGK